MRLLLHLTVCPFLRNIFAQSVANNEACDNDDYIVQDEYNCAALRLENRAAKSCLNGRTRKYLKVFELYLSAFLRYF